MYVILFYITSMQIREACPKIIQKNYLSLINMFDNHMFRQSKYLTFLTTLILLFNQATGQSRLNEMLINKLEHQKQLQPVSLFFIHTDKTIYTNNETIWWAGYLIYDTLSVTPPNILSIALVNETTKEIFAEKMHRLDKGLASGTLVLPDTIPPGDYQLVAYPNLLDKNEHPISVFKQPLTIKSIRALPFNTKFTFLDSTINNNDSLKIDVMVLQGDVKSASNAVLEYQSANNKTIKIQTDNFGKAIFSIPRSSINPSYPMLRTTTIFNGEKFFFNLKLPVQKPDNRFSVRFYPEGGDWVEDITSRIGWETLNGEHNPIPLQAILYKNLEPIDTIQTNSYGMGEFYLNPEPETNYYVKLINAGADTIKYYLPKPLTKGWVVKVNKAVLDSTLQLHIQTNTKDSFSVAVFNSVTGFVSNKMNIDGERLLTLKLNQMPKGLLTITLLNGNNQPVAERLVFVHYNLRNNVEIKTDREMYKKRDSINLTIQVKDNTGNPIKAIVSVACIQDNRIERNKQQDIESWFYLHQHLGNLPLYDNGRGLNSPDYLEKILLVKGWRKYNWQSIVSLQEDSLRIFHKPGISGNVLRYGKSFKKTASLILMAPPNNVNLLNADTQGHFELPSDYITIEDGRKIYINVNNENKTAYSYTIENPFSAINQKIAKEELIKSISPETNYNANTKVLLLNDFNRYKMLEEVVVKSKRDNSLFGVSKKEGPNACGDYVCVNGILNCPRHGTGTQPVKGQRYTLDGVGLIIYQGCSISEEERNYLKPVEGVYLAKTYYGVDSVMRASLNEEFLSTIFWKPQFLIQPNTTNKQIFYTSDITGKFRIVIQGIGENGEVFSAEKRIEVRE
jgi:hypothetical protein